MLCLEQGGWECRRILRFNGLSVDLVVAGAFRKREWRATATASGYRVSFWDDENVMELDSGRDYTTLQIP